MKKIVGKFTAASIALTVGLLASGCSSVPPVQAPQVKSEKTAESARETLHSFFDQVREDSTDYRDRIVEVTDDADKDAILDEEFEESVAYVHPNSFTEEEREYFTSFFAYLFLTNPDSTISSDAADYVLEGDTAVIKASDMSLSVGDEEPNDSSGSTGRIELTFVDDEWLISEFVVSEESEKAKTETKS